MSFKIDFDLIAPTLPKPKKRNTPILMNRPKKWTKAKSGRLIRKAAEIMKDKGYTQGSLHDSNGFCIRGATNYAWCGNAVITDSYSYAYADDSRSSYGGPSNRRVRNPEVVQTLTDLRAYLEENGLFPNRPWVKWGVESFNDKRDKDEVIRWMLKFADEVDPQK